jgi:ribosomal protein L28
MFVAIFSANFVWNISHSKKKSARYYKCTLALMSNNRYSCPSVIKLEFLERFSKNSQIPNTTTISLVGTEFFHADRRTDRYYEANSYFSKFF